MLPVPPDGDWPKRPKPEPHPQTEQSNNDEQERLLHPLLGTTSNSSSRTGLLWGTTTKSERVLTGTSSAVHSVTKQQQVDNKTWLQDLIMLLRVFFVRGLFVRRRWLFPLLLACSAASYEVAASTILDVISDFYLAISSRDASLFLQILWKSLLVVCLVAFLKASRDLAKEACALVWRQGLVSFLHSWYIKGKTPYLLSSAEAGRIMGVASSGRGSPRRPLDNPDQRVTVDAEALTTAFASVVHATFVVPGLVAYYTWYLVGMFGWTAPIACYVYFVVGSTVNWAVMRRVVPAVYRRERAEGSFRYDHACLRTHSESVVFCGVEAVEGRERERLDESFDAVVDASWVLIRRHVPLYVLTQFFDYLGSIINYAAVGGAILYLSKAEGRGEAEISALIARGSYSCLYLIDAFSQALRACEAASRVGGSAGRVAELLRATGFSDSDARKLGPWSINPPAPHRSSNNLCSGCCPRQSRGRGESLFSAWRAGFAWAKQMLFRGGDDRKNHRVQERSEECGWEHAAEYVPPNSNCRGDIDDTDYEAAAASAAECEDAATAGDSCSGFSLNHDPIQEALSGGSHDRAGPRSATTICAVAVEDGGGNEDDWLLRVDGYTVAQPEPWSTIASVAFGVDNDGSHSSHDGGESKDNVGTADIVEEGRGLVSSPSPPINRDDGLCSGSRNRRGAAIVRELTFTIRRGENLLVMGPSGCGKTSLLRSIAGLWEAEAGTLELDDRAENARRARETQGVGPFRRRSNSGEGVMFLPQRPYCFRGTLFEQVAYPSRPDAASAPLIEKILVDLGLAHLLVIGRGAAFASSRSNSSSDMPGRSEASSAALTVTHGEDAAAINYNVSMETGRSETQQPPFAIASIPFSAAEVSQSRREWAAILSVGEQQRIGIARLLYHRPALAFLDEGTSAVTETTERNIYGFLMEAGVTVVTVGHRTSLRALHERVLSLEGAPDGRWDISGV